MAISTPQIIVVGQSLWPTLISSAPNFVLALITIWYAIETHLQRQLNDKLLHLNQESLALNREQVETLRRRTEEEVLENRAMAVHMMRQYQYDLEIATERPTQYPQFRSIAVWKEEDFEKFRLYARTARLSAPVTLNVLITQLAWFLRSANSVQNGQFSESHFDTESSEWMDKYRWTMDTLVKFTGDEPGT